MPTTVTQKILGMPPIILGKPVWVEWKAHPGILLAQVLATAQALACRIRGAPQLLLGMLKPLLHSAALILLHTLPLGQAHHAVEEWYTWHMAGNVR